MLLNVIFMFLLLIVPANADNTTHFSGYVDPTTPKSAPPNSNSAGPRVSLTGPVTICPFVKQKQNGTNAWFFMKDNADKLRLYFEVGGVTKAYYIMTNAWSVSANTWYHLAAVRDGSNVHLFIDGVAQVLTADTPIGSNDVGDISAVLAVGADSTDGTESVNGWMDEVRVSKGIARWTSNFTPPTLAYSSQVF